MNPGAASTPQAPGKHPARISQALRKHVTSSPQARPRSPGPRPPLDSHCRLLTHPPEAGPLAGGGRPARPEITNW